MGDVCVVYGLGTSDEYENQLPLHTFVARTVYETVNFDKA
jgi:hypothetical protein